MAVTPARWHRHLAAVLAAACACTAVSAVTSGTAASAVTSGTAANAVTSGTAANAVTSGAALAQSGKQHDTPRLTSNQRAVLLDATHRFRDVKRAVAAGYLPTKDCVPGMGYHYAKPALSANPDIDPTLPELLVYAPAAGGSVRLAALEYFRPDADGDLKTAGDRPTLLGHPFDGPMAGHPLPPGVPPMPVHYDLHVWLYQPNPSGELTSENPEVTCP